MAKNGYQIWFLFMSRSDFLIPHNFFKDNSWRILVNSCILKLFKDWKRDYEYIADFKLSAGYLRYVVSNQHFKNGPKWRSNYRVVLITSGSFETFRGSKCNYRKKKWKNSQVHVLGGKLLRKLRNVAQMKYFLIMIFIGHNYRDAKIFCDQVLHFNSIPCALVQIYKMATDFDWNYQIYVFCLW